MNQKDVNKRGEYVNFGIQWLLDHHLAKQEQRRKMVDDLNLKKGDSILDIGCGPGLWSTFLAEKIYPDGKVIGIDIDSEFISYAERNLEDKYKEIINFQEGDFSCLPFADESFDMVFFGNCFAYVTQYDKILQEQKRVIKVGGRIAIKDFEGSVIVINPIDPLLTLKVLTATAQSLNDNPPDPPFDNFAGRKLRQLLLNTGFKNVSVISYGVQIVPPLTPEAKRYIVGNAQWYGKKAQPYLSEKDFKQWQEYFDDQSDQYILDSNEFYFCMLEVLAMGHKAI